MILSHVENNNKLTLYQLNTTTAIFKSITKAINLVKNWIKIINDPLESLIYLFALALLLPLLAMSTYISFVVSTLFLD